MAQTSSGPKFFDAHTHVQFSAFDADRDAVLARAREAGVWMVNVGTQIDTSRAGVELAEKFDEGVYAAIGLHPVHTSRSHHDAEELGGGEAAKAFVSRGEALDIEAYRRLALHEKTVAIGECGLDYFHFNDAEPRDEQVRKQKEAFIAQIQLSLDVKKPLMIHCREAFADLVDVLKFYEKKFDRAPGVIHFFTGTSSDAQALIDIGFSFTFGGATTYPPRKGASEGTYDEVVKMIPADRILSETDAPYVAPVPYRGKRNEPMYIPAIAERIALLKNISPEEMKEQIFANARKMFGL